MYYPINEVLLNPRKVRDLKSSSEIFKFRNNAVIAIFLCLLTTKCWVMFGWKNMNDRVVTIRAIDFVRRRERELFVTLITRLVWDPCFLNAVFHFRSI